MKKKIYFALIFMIMFMTNINIISADTVMYLDCPVHSECDGASRTSGVVAGSRCQTEIHQLARFTSNKGNSEVNWVDLDAGQWGEYYPIGCWLEGDFNDLFNSCKEKNEYSEPPSSLFEKRVCPVAVRNNKNFLHIDGATKGVTKYNAVGKTTPKKVVLLGEPEYIIYNFTDKKGNKQTFVEGYTAEGQYSYVGPNIVKLTNDEIYTHQMKLMYNVGVDQYFKVASNFNTLLVAKNGQKVKDISICESKEDCINNHNFEIIVDSKDSNGNFRENVNQWYDKEKENYLQVQEKMMEIINKKEFIDACKGIEEASKTNVKYVFPKNYSASEMIDDLSVAYESLTAAYDIKFTNYVTGQSEEDLDPIGSAQSFFWTKLFNIADVKEFEMKDKNQYQNNINQVRDMIAIDIANYVEEISPNDNGINILNLGKSLDNYLILFTTASVYLDNYYYDFGLTDAEHEEIVDIREIYEEFGESKNIVVVYDCKGLLGQDLIDKINSYLDIIKIAIPIILIVFGIIDFTKAVFASDEDTMKKAQQDFIKRLGIAILIFLVPTILNLILNLANKVWPIIEPSTCGIFE